MADLPVPPPFMWACPRCTALLVDLADAFGMLAFSDLYEGALRCQMMLASHLAHEHLVEVPEPHEDCERCDFYRKCTGSQGIDDLWAEHRARDLFLPASVARRM